MSVCKVVFSLFFIYRERLITQSSYVLLMIVFNVVYLCSLVIFFRLHHSKQVRQDLLNTKELLRNAVSRAPLVTLHPLDTAGTGTSGDAMVGSAGAADEEVKVVLQGPDVRPPGFTTIVIEEAEDEVEEVVVEEAVPTRVAIVDDDEGSSAPTAAATNTTVATTAAPSAAPAAGTTTTRVAITIDDDSDAEVTPTTHPETNTTINSTATDALQHSFVLLQQIAVLNNFRQMNCRQINQRWFICSNGF